MPITDRIINERNFAQLLNKATSYRKELLEMYSKAVDEETNRPYRQEVVDWTRVGTIERQCALLKDLLNEFDADLLP